MKIRRKEYKETIQRERERERERERDGQTGRLTDNLACFI
jgi:hypothetical protein